MKLKVLQVGKFYYPYKGGMETVLKDLCEGFNNSSQTITRVICSSETTQKQITQERDLQIYKYPVLFTVASQQVTPGLILSFFTHVLWADIIHIHSPNPIIEFLCLFIPQKKIICTHHSDIHKQKILKYFYFPFWRLFKKRVDKFIVPTTNHIKYSSMINDISEKVEVIPFGIKEETYTEISDATLTEKYEDFILFVGRLVEYKGLEYLIKSMIGIDKQLVIIGRGPLRTSLLELIRDTDQESKISILSDIDLQKDLNCFYKNAYSFVLPSISKNENFGIVQLEAMLFSLPIITTNLKSGVPIVGIPGSTTLLIEPKSVKELNEAINKLYENPEFTKQLGENGHKLFYEKYTYNNMISKHLELIKRVYNE